MRDIEKIAKSLVSGLTDEVSKGIGNEIGKVIVDQVHGRLRGDVDKFFDQYGKKNILQLMNVLDSPIMDFVKDKYKRRGEKFFGKLANTNDVNEIANIIDVRKVNKFIDANIDKIKKLALLKNPVKTAGPFTKGVIGILAIGLLVAAKTGVLSGIGAYAGLSDMSHMRSLRMEEASDPDAGKKKEKSVEQQAEEAWKAWVDHYRQSENPNYQENPDHKKNFIKKFIDKKKKTGSVFKYASIVRNIIKGISL